MTELHSRIMRGIVIVIAVGIAVSVAPADDREFNLLASHLQQHSLRRRADIPMIGLANLLAPITRPTRFVGVKVALFEHPDAAALFEGSRLDGVVRTVLGSRWRPLMRRQFRRNAEQTHIYTRASGERHELMIVEVRSPEASVVHLTLDREQFARYLVSPEDLDRDIRSDISQPSLPPVTP